MRDGSKRELERRFGSAINIAAMALVQFLVFCPVAILVYPGEFSLASDYLSFLGCFENLKSLHAWIFNLSLIGLGSGLFWMFWSLFRVTKNDPGELLICSVTGMLSAGSLVLVGLLPVNIFRDGHVFAMASWLFFTVMTLVFWLDWQRLDPGQKPTSVATLGVIAILAYPFAVMLAWGPAMQKVIVVLEIGWFGYFCQQLRHVLTFGKVRKWLNTGPRPERLKKGLKVHYIEPFSSANQDRHHDP